MAWLPVSPETYKEIREKLAAAGYEHAIQHPSGDGSERLDMEGLCLVVTPSCKLCGKERQPWQVFCGAACCARWEAGERPTEASP